MMKCSIFERSKQLAALIYDVKWDVLGLLLFVPLASQSINRFLGSEPLLRRLGTFREPLIEMLVLAGMGIFMSVKAAESLRTIERLRASEARYRGVVEDQTELICRFLPDWTLTFVNEAYCRYFGKGKGQFVGRNFMSLIPMEEHEKVVECLASLSPLKPFSVVEHQVLAPGGPRWQQWTNRAIFGATGRVVEFQAVGRDVTERKRAESELERSMEELKEKNADLEMMNYTISHDLKSPVITVRGFLRRVERDAERGVGENLKSYLQVISKAAARMEELTDQLSLFTRIGRLSKEIEEIQFGHVAHEAKELVAGRIAQSGVDVTIAPDLPTIRANRSLMLQVLQNLIENSIKFMGDQLYPKVEIGARPDEFGQVFYVRDNGVGIDPSCQERVFARFNRLECKDVKVEGSGLGLALVKRAIEVHGGKIWVESEGSGRGSTFCFRLPASS
jgi:PAS domain S-box-containing protein